MPRYPFTPDLLDVLPEELAELFRSLELTLLKEIVSRLKIRDNLNEVTVQDIRALRSHGIGLDEINKAIRETAGISEEKLNKLLDEVVARNQAYYEEIIDLAKITEPQAYVDAIAIEMIRRQAFDEVTNLTRSMVFLVEKGRKFLPPAKSYQWVLDSAVLQVESGAISYDQAIRDAVRQLADSGLKVVDYESGWHNRIDVAVRRAVMTGVNQINQKYREQSMEYLETDLVEVTAHLGARNIDGPKGWENHAKWQGGVYRWAAKQRASTGHYKDFEKTCSYGDVQGIGGANCRHSWWPFIEGVSERTYTDKELESMKPENRPKIEFEGREYDDYQAAQQQRRIEAEIRKQKRCRTALEAAGLEEDAAAVGACLRRLNAKYKAFSNAAGLPLRRARMNITYPAELTDIKLFEPLKEYQGSISVVDKFSERQYVVKLDPPIISGTTQHFEDNLSGKTDRVGLTVEVAQSIINNNRLVIYQTDKKSLKFLADNGYVVLGMRKQIITAVPEKLRKKYRDYLEGKQNGKKS